MKRGGYIDPCGIWWALPNAKSSSVTFIQRSREKLAYKQHILQTHSLSNISIKEVVAGKISIGSKIIEKHIIMITIVNITKGANKTRIFT